jgi:four helix bundle protein
MTNQSFRDLVIWQRAMDLTYAIYAATSVFPKSELFALVQQMRRAAISIPSNIAEGHARQSTRQFRHFLRIASGSLAELQTQLILARGLGYATPALLDPCDALAYELQKMLPAFIAKLKPPPKPKPKP